MIGFAIVQMLAVVGLPAAGVALIVLGCLGRRDPTKPLCGRCGAALRFEHIDADAPCACGARASEAAPRPARRRPWIGGLIGGIACILVAAALFVGAVAWVTSVSQASAPRFATTPNTVLVSGAMTSQFPSEEIPELKRRLADGSLSADALKSAFLAGLGTSGASVGLPARGAVSVGFLVMQSCPEDAELPARVLESCFPPASIPAQFLAARNPTVQLDPTLEPHTDVPLARLAVLRAVKVDGTALALPDALGRAVDRPASLPLSLKPLGPGRHELELELELFLFDRFDAERCTGAAGRTLPETDWPPPLARRMTTIRATVDSPK